MSLQRAKTNAAIEKAVAAEKSAAAAGSKIKLLEDEIDDIRAKHRNTPEVALLQQIAEVKGQLAESLRRIETIKAEKAEIVLEKEQFRASVNKLVSLITSGMYIILSIIFIHFMCPFARNRLKRYDTNEIKQQQEKKAIVSNKFV